jgi:hypothetical protein
MLSEVLLTYVTYPWFLSYLHLLLLQKVLRWEMGSSAIHPWQICSHPRYCDLSIHILSLTNPTLCHHDRFLSNILATESCHATGLRNPITNFLILLRNIQGSWYRQKKKKEKLIDEQLHNSCLLWLLFIYQPGHSHPISIRHCRYDCASKEKWWL